MALARLTCAVGVRKRLAFLDAGGSGGGGACACKAGMEGEGRIFLSDPRSSRLQSDLVGDSLRALLAASSPLLERQVSARFSKSSPERPAAAASENMSWPIMDLGASPLHSSSEPETEPSRWRKREEKVDVMEDARLDNHDG